MRFVKVLLCLLLAQSVFAQQLIMDPRIQAINANGDPISGAKLYVDNAGTSTDRTTYSDAALTTANANPLVADSAGRFGPIFVAPSETKVKLTLTTSADVSVWTQDNVSLTEGVAALSISTFGVVCDGSTNDATALQAAFTAADNKTLVFPEDETCAFETGLTIPSGAVIDFNGSALRKTVSDATDGYQLTVGADATIRDVTLEIPTGVDVERVLSLEAGSKAYNVKMTSVDQINNLGSTERAALNAEGDNIVIDGLIAENFDRPIRIENGEHGYFNNIRVNSYVTGLALDTYEYFTISNFIAEVESPNASSSSGHSGMTLTNPQQAIVSNVQIYDPSEHGIYLSVGPDDDHKFFAFNNINVTRPGNSCLKMAGALAADGGARVQHVQVTGLRCVDAHFGSSAGANEDGLRIEQADHVKVSGFSVAKDQNGTSAYYGLYVRDSTDVMVNAPVMDDIHQYGIYLADEGVAETISDITIRSPVIRGGVDSIRIDADTASSALANINITDAYMASPTGYGVTIDAATAGVSQPIYIEGRVRSAGTGVYNNLITGTAINLVSVRLKDAETHETVTGTVTLSVYGDHSGLNSAAGAVTATLPNGVVVGQCKTITMTDASNSSTVSVTSHETSDPEVFTFAQTTDVLVQCWTGAEWYTAKNIGVTT